MKKITFIHAADLHLDSPMMGLSHLPQNIFKRLQESSFISFSKIIDTAITNRVDFVILSGDLYDAEDRSIRAQTRFRKQIERLAEYRIPVYIVHGNHDHLDGSWANIPLPQNTYTFPAEVEAVTFTKDEHTTVSLYGFSYPNRHVTERRIDEYKRIGEADFHIGLLHGHFEGSSDHGRYAPFHLNDLIEKNFDYWALGHIHKRTTLKEDPPIIYPGNIQGRHRKETGEKGCYLVSLTETEKSLKFIPTSDCVWDEIDVDASYADTVADLYQICRKVIDSINRDGVGTLLTLKLVGVSLSEQQSNLLLDKELLETLQDEQREEEPSFVWPVQLIIEEANTLSREQLANDADFFEEMFRTIDTFESLDNSLAPLYHHGVARKYISSLDEQEKEQILKEAEMLLVKLLKND